ncbi:hypothetical protein FACS189475_06550 [Betaproteobacteria bacterium]|nr:hypothetical protein FACS189475_06550 [Betaproteobacteria bacterium]
MLEAFLSAIDEASKGVIAMEIEKNIRAANGANEFQVRLIKNEGVGLLTDRNGGSYLMLDSLQYWYDLIQNGYPKKVKCACKNEWFTVTFRYLYRDDSPDIREVQIVTTCAACGKSSTRMSIDIDYSPTDSLVSTPITYCEKPDIRYKFSESSSFWTDDDLARFLRFMLDELNLTAYYHYFKQPENVRVFEALPLEQAIERSGLFLRIYFTHEPIENAVTFEDEKGVIIDRSLWRKQEMVMLSGMNIYEIGRMYFVKYCNQYISEGDVKDKSAEFEALTTRIMVWLRENFIGERGPNCFDGEEGYRKLREKRGARL